jgi:hypothetical protein
MILFIAAKLGILGRQKIPRIINLSDCVFNGDNVHLFEVKELLISIVKQ